MYQAPASQPSTCRGCGNPVARDHAADLFCNTCQRTRRDYDPRHDCAFPEALLALLTAHPGRPINVYRELGIEHCGLLAWRCVHVHVRCFRRHGHRVAGYRLGTTLDTAAPPDDLRDMQGCADS